MAIKEIFYLVEGSTKVHSISFDADLKLSDLRKKICEEHGLEIDLNFYFENQDSPLDLEKELSKLDVKESIKIHVTRCRQIKVVVTYNGSDVEKMFSPATTIATVRDWAISDFAIGEIDARELYLKVGTNEWPKPIVHIGSLVVFPEEQIHFNLGPKERVQG